MEDAPLIWFQWVNGNVSSDGGEWIAGRKKGQKAWGALRNFKMAGATHKAWRSVLSVEFRLLQNSKALLSSGLLHIFSC